LETYKSRGICVNDNVPLIMAIEALQLKMPPNEIWNAVTVNAAHAIDAHRGTLEPGDAANIVVWDAPNHEYIPYHYGVNHAYKVIPDGKLIFELLGLNL